MRKFIFAVTSVTLAFVLIILLVGCKNVQPAGSPSEPLTSTLDEPTLPVTFDFGDVSRSVDIFESTEEPTTEINTTETLTETELTETEESTKEEPVLESTDVIAQTEETSAEETLECSTEVGFTFTELAKSMFVQNSVNIRVLPNIEGDIAFVLERDAEVWVTGRCVETGWYRIDVGGQTFYVSDGYVADTKYVAPTTVTPTALVVRQTQSTSQGFVYYSVAGVWPNRDYEEYLYNCLVDRGIEWWYPYAVAQIFQESRWNPNSTNGRDHGICQFKGESFQARAIHHAGLYNADIWNPYDSLYVYSFYIRDVLASVNWNVEDALSFYIVGNWGIRHDTYVNYVMGWYNQLGR